MVYDDQSIALVYAWFMVCDDQSIVTSSVCLIYDNRALVTSNGYRVYDYRVQIIPLNPKQHGQTRHFTT